MKLPLSLHRIAIGLAIVLGAAGAAQAQEEILIGASESALADIVLVDAIPPQANSMRKQMACAGLTPKILVPEAK